MKKLMVGSFVAAMAVSSYADVDVEALQKQVDALQKQVLELKKSTGSDNLKWSADYRASYDTFSYKNSDGKTYDNNVLSNRLWLGFKAAPRSDLSFIGQLSYNKLFGDTADKAQRGGARDAAASNYFANFDWFVNEKSSDNDVKVKTLYAIYFGEMGDVPYSASIGRRPSTNGLLVSLRDDDPAASPLGHSINVEFDGASFKFDLDKITDVPGMSFKLCMGRALSNSTAYLSSGSSTTGLPDYAEDETKNPSIDMVGFVFVPYDNGQYSLTTQYAQASHLIGFTGTDMNSYNTAYKTFMGSQTFVNYMAMMNAAPHFKDVGDIQLGTVSFLANGIGEGLSDFLDSTTAFASWSFSKTDPNSNGMLGSTDSKMGQSWYVGVQMPALVTDDGYIGLEYNQGSKYWRSFTYGEDTVVGSKLAARGQAYEAYYTQPILGQTLSAQIRYTYIDYEYSGSNGFFGADGAPTKISDLNAAMGQYGVDKATNLRAYLRYRF